MREQIKSYLSVAFTLAFVLLKGQKRVSIVNAQPTSSFSFPTSIRKHAHQKEKIASSSTTTTDQKGSKQHSSLFIENYNSSLVSHIATIQVKSNYTDYLLSQHANNDLGDSLSSSPLFPLDEKESSRAVAERESIGISFSPSPSNFQGGEKKNTGSFGNTGNPTVSPSPSSTLPAAFKIVQRKTAPPTISQTSVASQVSAQMMYPSDSPTSDQTPKSNEKQPKINRCDCSTYSKEHCKKCTALNQANEADRSDDTNHNIPSACSKKKCLKRCCDWYSDNLFETTAASSMSYSPSNSKQKKKRKNNYSSHKDSVSSMSSYYGSPSPNSFGVAKIANSRATSKPLHSHETTCDCSKYTSKDCKQCIRQDNIKNTSLGCGKKKCVKRCCKSQSESFFDTATSSMSFSTTSSKTNRKKKIHNPKDVLSSNAYKKNVPVKGQRKSGTLTNDPAFPTSATVQAVNPNSPPSIRKLTKRPYMKNKKEFCRCSSYSPESCRKCITEYNLEKNKQKGAANSPNLSCGKKTCVRRCCGSIKEGNFLNTAASSCLSYASRRSEKKKKQNHKESSSPHEAKSIF